MRVFRFIMLGLMGLLLVLSIAGWIVSHFRMHRFYFRAGDVQIAVVIVAGDLAVGAGVERSNLIPSGLSHESQEITPWTLMFLGDKTTLGFAVLKEGGFTGCFMPFWFLTLMLTGLTGVLVWRVIAARPGKMPPAFPVEKAGETRSDTK